MGSQIEFNDTLQITTEQGFPEELSWERHSKDSYQLSDVSEKVFLFWKPGIRLFHPAPVPVQLAQNIDGKWIYWGHAYVIEQTIDTEKQLTTGKFKIVSLWPAHYQRERTIREAGPHGKSYFGETV